MPREQLRESLQQLHDQLTSASSIEPETRRLLEQVATDITGILDRSVAPEPGGAPGNESSAGIDPADETPSMLDNVRQLADQFEESHPSLAMAVGRIADALSQMGI